MRSSTVPIWTGVLPSVLVLMLASGCAVVPPVVPVVGTAGDVAALAGVWKGSCRNPGINRSGAVHFEVVAEADTSSAGRGAPRAADRYR